MLLTAVLHSADQREVTKWPLICSTQRWTCLVRSQTVVSSSRQGRLQCPCFSPHQCLFRQSIHKVVNVNRQSSFKDVICLLFGSNVSLAWRKTSTLYGSRILTNFTEPSLPLETETAVASPFYVVLQSRKLAWVDIKAVIPRSNSNPILISVIGPISENIKTTSTGLYRPPSRISDIKQR